MLATILFPRVTFPGSLPTPMRPIADLAAGSVPEQPEGKPVPAVSIRKSVTPDFLICLEGRQEVQIFEAATLATHYDLTPEQYRAKWNLPSDYPMVAPNYSAAALGYGQELGDLDARLPSLRPRHRPNGRNSD